ncbi:hypothetical protein Drorol1_Dr00016557 [Drosera rotundifolia]
MSFTCNDSGNYSSLELKVKRLEEEREKTMKTMVDDIEGGADLINGNESRSRYPATMVAPMRLTMMIGPSTSQIP